MAIGEMRRPHTLIVRTMERLAHELGAALSPRADTSPAYETVQPPFGGAIALATGIQRDALVDVLAHELRAPLGAAEYVLEKLSPPAEALPDGESANLVEIARMAVEEAQRVVRWFSQIHTLTYERARPQLRAVSLGQCLDRALALLPATTSRVCVDLPNVMPEVLADPLWLTHVFTNLIENATKYATPPHQPELTARVLASNRVVVSVTSRGSGIPSSAQETVFTSYTRHAGSDDLTSKGLGLTIARYLLKEMGGAIRVESDGYSSTTVVVELRIAE